MKSHDKKCLKLFEEENLSYAQIMERLDLTYDEVKHALKRARDVYGRSEIDPDLERFKLKSLIMKQLKHGITKEEICDKFSLSEEKVNDLLADISENDGITIDSFAGMLKLGQTPAPEDYVHLHKSNSWRGNVVRFGVISDTHLCSKYCQIESLHKYYDILEEEEIDTVYNAGDLMDGEGVYEGQIYELDVIGSDNQVEYTVDNYPRRKGITTYFITGNHDLKYFKKQARDVGKSVARERDDMIYLGQLGAYVDLSGKSVDYREIPNRPFMYLIHPDGGLPYAASYRSQVLARGFTEISKPDIMIVGHLHTSGYFIDRGIHIIQAGSFQDQTLYIKRKGIFPQIGGWIVEIGITGSEISSVTTTFKLF